MNPTIQLNKKQRIAIAIVLAIGVLLAGLILMKNKTSGSIAEHGAQQHPEGKEHADKENRSTTEEQKNIAKGPHGGKLFTQGEYGLEVAIFETNVEPEFRLYAYKNEKALPPAISTVTLTLERLGRTPQVFSFTPEKDYIKGNAVVEEPHSFKVSIASQYDGKSYHFGYEQVEARVNMTDMQLKQNGVDLAVAGPKKIQSTLSLVGEVRFNEDRIVQIVPRLTGLVETVLVNAGDKVQKGQVLAVISSQTLADQRSDLLAAQKRYSLARATFEREKKLWEEKISAEQDYLQARNAMQETEIILQGAQQKLSSLGATANINGNLTRYEIRSPITGTVTEKHIAMGQSLKDDTPIFIVADLSSVWVEIKIPAKDLNLVKTGQQAKIMATALDIEASGSLSYVGSLVGDQSRAAIGHIVLVNTKGLWRPGLPVSVNLVSEETEVPVAVTVEAIQSLKDSSTVFGRYGENFEARPVKLGRSDGKFVEIIKGLHAGERYASKNSFLIKADIGKSGASHDH
ncbi:efflux RND transporter periplasmic adaptor subunit [Undibacterium sp. Rencai35W]|uniref:efflux RND transporter periplasmic adaptor subunit n=1 Tax=Undibacterium sp. Rencai35W TaxID=3413046 RepID=UPI003BF21319